MQKVILTMTTIPNRLCVEQESWGTKAALSKLLNLSYNNYELHLNIPSYYKANSEPYIIPEWLKNYDNDRLKIFRTEDLGPITKIVPTLLRITDPDAVIITVDDDLLYEELFIEYHLEKRKIYPNAALGFAGLGSVIDRGVRFCTTVEQDTRVKILENYKTVSYLRSFFKEDFFTDFVGKHWSDDILISAYLGKENIEKIVLTYDKDTDFTPRVESFPVIRPLPNHFGGCRVFRDRDNTEYDAVENEFYKIGYLER
jgi:hypothetical protein